MCSILVQLYNIFEFLGINKQHCFFYVESVHFLRRVLIVLNPYVVLVH